MKQSFAKLAQRLAYDIRTCKAQPRPLENTMKPFIALLPAFALLAGGCANAQERPASAATPASAPAANEANGAPTLVVAISVDQLSADLFEQYRAHFYGGLARLLSGAVFPNGYQAHAATETCPGHSTILTGFHPATNGIIANGWADFTATRDDKEIYCAEDEDRTPSQSSERYVASSIHLKVPTLGKRLKDAFPDSRNVAIAGKDRAALMMAGPTADSIGWYTGKGFGNFGATPASPTVDRVNAQIEAIIATGVAEMTAPAWCSSRSIPFDVGDRTVGTGRFALESGDGRGFLASPRSDSAVLQIAAGLVAEHDLGGRGVPDVLSIGLSATDYVGHGYGTNGIESCMTVANIDAQLGSFFDTLDARGIDYVVVLTADHGGLDIPERASAQGAPTARRVDAALVPEAMGTVLAEKYGLSEPALLGDGPFGDIYLNPAIPAGSRAEILADAKASYSAHPDVAAAFTSAEIMATEVSTGDPREWSMLERLRASHYPGRSGDLLVLLKPGVTPIPNPSSYVATHGSAWDYDRRVPILFWRAGMTGFEQSLPALTVDILPTLMGVLDMQDDAALDGVCRDILAGPESSCE